MALSYLSEFREDPRARAALSRALADQGSIRIDLLNQKMPGVDQFWVVRDGLRVLTLGMVVNRSDVPSAPIVKLARNALLDWPGGADVGALAQVLAGTAEETPYDAPGAARALYEVLQKSGGKAADDIGAGFRDALDDETRKRLPGTFDAITASDISSARNLAVHLLTVTDDPSAATQLATLSQDRDRTIAKAATKALAKREKIRAKKGKK